MGTADALTGSLDGRDGRERRRSGGARQENFIPWSQIKPLMRPGMTGGDLSDAIVAALGLDPARYYTYTTTPMNVETLSRSVRRGVYVGKVGDARWNDYDDCADETVA